MGKFTMRQTLDDANSIRLRGAAIPKILRSALSAIGIRSSADAIRSGAERNVAGDRGDFGMAMDVLKRVLNGSASAVALRSPGEPSL
jgi:hypothetical protein